MEKTAFSKLITRRRGRRCGVEETRVHDARTARVWIPPTQQFFDKFQLFNQPAEYVWETKRWSIVNENTKPKIKRRWLDSNTEEAKVDLFKNINIPYNCLLLMNRIKRDHRKKIIARWFVNMWLLNCRAVGLESRDLGFKFHPFLLKNRRNSRQFFIDARIHGN